MSDLSVLGVSPKPITRTTKDPEVAKTVHDWGLLHGLGVRPPATDTVEIAKKLAGDAPPGTANKVKPNQESWTQYFSRIVVKPLNPQNWTVPKVVKEQMEVQKLPYVLVAMSSLVPWAARLNVPGAAWLSAAAQNAGHVAKVFLLNSPGNFLTSAMSDAANRTSLRAADKHAMAQMYSAGLHAGEQARKTGLFQRVMDVLERAVPAFISGGFGWVTSKLQFRHEEDMAWNRMAWTRIDNLHNN